MASPVFPDRNGVPIEVGARVWAQHDDGQWWAGYVFKHGGGLNYHIYYDSDGSEDTLPANRLAVANVIKKVSTGYDSLNAPAIKATLTGNPSSMNWLMRINAVGFSLPLMWAMWHYVNDQVFNGVLAPPEIGYNTRNVRAIALCQHLGGGRCRLTFSVANLSLKDLLDSMAHEMVHQYQYQELVNKGVKIDDFHGETFLAWRGPIERAIQIRIAKEGKPDDTIEFTPSRARTQTPIYVAAYWDGLNGAFKAAVVPDVGEARRLLTRSVGRNRHTLWKAFDSQIKQITFPGRWGALRFSNVTANFIKFLNENGEKMPGYLTLPHDYTEKRVPRDATPSPSGTRLLPVRRR